MKQALIIIILLVFFKGYSQVSNTYSSGNISTNYGSYSSTCNGPTTTLNVTLPAGVSWEVTSVDVSYDFTACNGAWKSELRSQIYCQNTSMEKVLIQMDLEVRKERNHTLERD